MKVDFFERELHLCSNRCACNELHEIAYACVCAATITKTRATDMSDSLHLKLFMLLFARNMVFYIRFVVSKNNCQFKTILVKHTCGL